MSISVARWAGLVGLRLLRLGLLLLFVVVVAFALLKLSPIDPVNAYLGPEIAHVGPEARALIAERWGLDQPPIAQFGRWLGNVLVGEWGYSTLFNAPVEAVIASRFFASLPLVGLAWLFSGALGFALGLTAGSREGGWADRLIRLYSYGLASMPTFWLGMLLLLVFSVGLKWTPVCCAAPIGVDPSEASLVQRIHHLLLPLAALSLFGVAQIALHTRARVIEIMGSDYVTLARTQGASRIDIALRHGARNAALPAITVLFASLGELIGGVILAEQVFAYPGLGRATVEAGIRGDVPLLLAATLLLTLIVSTGNLIADLLYHTLDPRIRSGALGGGVA